MPLYARFIGLVLESLTGIVIHGAAENTAAKAYYGPKFYYWHVTM